jgi:hypothetical protein
LKLETRNCTFTLVDHLCYKCQTSIDESLPFCPHCGAPQIRVAMPEDDAPASPNAVTPNVSPATWGAAPPPYQPHAIQWDVAWKGAFLTGAIAGILTAAPIVSVGCCLWLLGAGALAVSLYQRRIPGAFVTPGMGMRLGALSGMCGFFAFAICYTFAFVRDSGEFRRVFIESIQRSSASNPDARVQEMVAQLVNNLNNPEVLATYFVFMLVIMAIVFVVFTAAGGALGASMFARRRNRR